MSKQEMISSAKVVNMESVSLAQRTRSAKPETLALCEKAQGLKVGQGFMLPKEMVIRQNVKAKNGKVYKILNYKGYNLLRKIQGKRFSTKRDTVGNLYLFRVAA
jgi:hypothetical protein